MSIENQKSQIENRLVECVPNFSEGRKPETIEQIAVAIESVAGAVVLNRHVDVDHNRSTATLERVRGAGFACAKAIVVGNSEERASSTPVN